MDSQTNDNSTNTPNQKVLSALHQPFFDQLVNSKNVLIAGCGGGYDIFCGLPLYFALRKCGCNVYLSNFTFSYGLEATKNTTKITNCCWEVKANSARTRSGWKLENEEYWPELLIASWLKKHENIDASVYTIERTGVKYVYQAYEKLCEILNLDTIILVDGGTDSLMFGNEQGLGTPTEDMSSICAINMLPNVPTKLLACLGFGVDSFHNVCHSHFLENTAALIRSGGFLGTFSVTKDMEEAQKMDECFKYSSPHNSIVNTSVQSAIEGHFGNYHSPHTKTRTSGSTLYISPLMSMYWLYHVEKVAEKVLYMDEIKHTETSQDTRRIIHAFCEQYFSKGSYVGPRKRESIPY